MIKRLSPKFRQIYMDEILLTTSSWRSPSPNAAKHCRLPGHLASLLWCSTDFRIDLRDETCLSELWRIFAVRIFETCKRFTPFHSPVMKLFKLWVHQHTFSEDELIVNIQDFPDCDAGDVLEIYHPDDQSRATRLLLQINSIRSDFQQKDTVSIEQSIANSFQLRTYSDVVVHKVPASHPSRSISVGFS